MHLKNRRTLIIVVILLFLIIFGYLNSDYLTLDYLKQHLAQFKSFYRENKLITISVFFHIYVFSTALSIPVATFLGLLAGALFGLALGTVIVSFASTFGATLAFLIARYIARDYVEKNLSRYIAPINKGIESEGAYYLFAARLVPIIPFFGINLVMGLTKMKTWTYFWVSQLGMFFGTVVYINAGAQLSKISKMEDIMSLNIMLSLVVLGLFPIVTKRIVEKWRSKA